MTNVKQVLEKSTKKSPYFDLVVQIQDPITIVLEKVSNRLNQKGLHSERTNRFSYATVANIYYGKYQDYRSYVRLELEEMVAEQKGIKDQLQPHFDAIREALAA